MVIKSVSMPDEMFIQAKNRGISLSVATQTGLSILFNGGLEEYSKRVETMETLQASLKDQNEIIKALKERINELKDEIEYLRKTYVTEDAENKATDKYIG